MKPNVCFKKKLKTTKFIELDDGKIETGKPYIWW